MNILIAPDKFKGTLPARQAAQALECGWRQARPADYVELLPISDGGEGFGLVMSSLLKAIPRKSRTVNAAGKLTNVAWWWDPTSRTAIIESARVIGLAMLPPEKYHAFDLDSRGLATVLRQAKAEGAERCLVGLGGSATNDGGFGMARALGWQFLDPMGRPILYWIGLEHLKTIVPPKAVLWPEEILVAVDVQNPLLGPRGATSVYGPQKGLSGDDAAVAEGCLRQLEKCIAQTTGRSLGRLPGAGAAGGLGFGLAAFLGAKLKPGFELVASYSGLLKRLRSADLVVTGEGRLDKSSLMGKGVGEVASLCRKHKVPCAVIAGSIEKAVQGNKLFAKTLALTDLTAEKNAQSRPEHWLEKAATQVAFGWGTSGHAGRGVLQPQRLPFRW